MDAKKETLEPGIVTDFHDRLSYAGYLHLKDLLAQHDIRTDACGPWRKDHCKNL